MDNNNDYWECDCCGRKERKERPHGIMNGEDAVLLCDRCYERTYGRKSTEE